MASALSSLSSRAIISRIMEEVETTPDDWVNRTSTPPLPSNTKTETYSGLGAVSQLAAWDNAMPWWEELRGYELSVTNAAYRAGFKVNVDDKRREKTGQVDMKITELGTNYNEHWQILATALLVANPTTTIDGQNFFDSDHNASGSNQTNLTSASGAAPTAAQMETGILNGVTTLWGLKNDKGSPINQSKRVFIMMVPLAMAVPLYGALRLSALAQTGGPQPSLISTMDGLQIIPAVNPRLTAASVAYLFAADGRTFIRQQETGPEITAIAEGSEHEKKYREHLYGVATVRGLGFGNWQSATRITFS